MAWEKGESGNPAGRPRGSVNGRTRALFVLDEVLSDANNRKRLRDKFEEAIKVDALRFFTQIVMPLLPKNTTIDLNVNQQVASTPDQIVLMMDAVTLGRPPAAIRHRRRLTPLDFADLDLEDN